MRQRSEPSPLETADTRSGQFSAPDRDGVSRLSWAITSLRARWPELSAANPAKTWQKLTLATLPLFLVLSVFPASAEPAVILLACVLFLPFAATTALRSAALAFALRRQETAPASAPSRSTTHPRYTVLVPLFRETEILEDLIEALERIDYPHAHLEIFIIVEACDGAMQDALSRVCLPAHMRVIVVPDAVPRTKPKALNFALTFATGEFLVVYDAEDMPEPDQLQLALAMFERSPELACVQARLNIYNAHDCWLTRQFTVEYTTLFDHLLPALERMGFPIPLGGTSNHFRRSVLEAAGGWDPFNVTEDADLGIRLARLGYPVKTLPSTTWEEAPPTLRVWLGQRTRWFKGWLQTFLVHTRNPRVALRELGPLKFAGLHVVVIGLLLSAYAHPWIYVLLSLELLRWEETANASNTLLEAVFWVGVANLFLAYAVSIALARTALRARGMHDLKAAALGVPVYWLLISLAAYRALGELLCSPFHWEKTIHRSRRHCERARKSLGNR